ncbi:MAG: hypothetical protein ACQESR_25045 [Planctomycetota bacterium]
MRFLFTSHGMFSGDLHGIERRETFRGVHVEPFCFSFIDAEEPTSLMRKV